MDYTDEVGSSPAHDQRPPWWESKLALLAAGFLLTGIIGPWLQFVQKTLELKRQTAYDLYTHQLGAMRDARRELTEVRFGWEDLVEGTQAFVSQAASAEAVSSALSEFLDKNRELRLHEYAKLTIMIQPFPKRGEMLRYLDADSAAWKVYADSTRKMTGGPAHQGRSPDLERAEQRFRENYAALRLLMENQIADFENANR